MDGCTDAHMDGLGRGWMNTQMERDMNGPTHGGTETRIDGHTDLQRRGWRDIPSDAKKAF